MVQYCNPKYYSITYLYLSTVYALFLSQSLQLFLVAIKFGKVQGIRSLISYEGTSASELISDFHNAVDDYLIMCKEEGTTPETAYKGSLNVRFKNSDLHRRAAIYAIKMHQSLNSFIEEAVEEKLERIAER